MLWVFYGKDYDKASKKLRSFVAVLEKKRPDAEVFHIDSENFSPSQFQEFIIGQGLFERKVVVVLRRVFENKEAKELILDRVKDLQQSQNAFILFEESLLKKELDIFSKHAESIEEFGVIGKKFDVGSAFALADALGKKDKLSMWIELRKALAVGSVIEELHGMFFWQVKSMILAKSAKTANEADLKPFVYTKSKKFAGNYSTNELLIMSHDLVDMYHKARRGEGELEVLVEKWVLRR